MNGDGKTLHRLVNGRLLRRGYTTGTCAAAAAGAAAWMLLYQSPCSKWRFTTPKGIELTLDIRDTFFSVHTASCAVRKDSGDDPDVTNGILVYAQVCKTPKTGIVIEGGQGVGRVTKPGLDQQVGEAAINSGPRRMITRECQGVCAAGAYTGGLIVRISIPGGEDLAVRTFNPRVGIIGGISVLGTSGIVEPMSEKAYADTIRVELNQIRSVDKQHKKGVIFTIGNFGETFVRDTLGLSLATQVKCSNFIGEALASASELDFTRILLVGHIGKLVKLGIGILNTHSSHGDGRIETLLCCALEAGASLEVLRDIKDCVSTDAALDILRRGSVFQQTMHILGNRIDATLRRRVPPEIAIAFICFDKKLSRQDRCGEIICQSPHADTFMEVFKHE
ncbi:MAG: cobalt-precorrin-5B (C(1))-methyltransferase CbiD [Treponema sp.]|nr:cobalt-precorrin-5B (C(1))-methyltransferase CbiD [Treponema sp.]